VVWLEGINDLSAGSTADQVAAGIRQGADLIHARGLKLIQGTITSALGNDTGNPAADVDRNERRKAVNAFIRSARIFESVADMDAATADPATGSMRDEFLVNSTLGTIDHLHPNRAGYLSMARTIDIRVLAPPGHGRRGSCSSARPAPVARPPGKRPRATDARQIAVPPTARYLTVRARRAMAGEVNGRGPGVKWLSGLRPAHTAAYRLSSA